MSKNTLAPGFKRFEFRAGLADAVWGGMMTEGDPSRNPALRPRMAVNGRLVGGELRERPGLSKLNSSVIHSASACIKNIVPFESPSKKLWILGNGCPGVSPSLGFYIASLDPEQDPEFQRAVHYGSLSTLIVLATYGGDLYIGTDDTLRRIQLIRMPWGTENLAASGSSQDTPIKTFTGYTISCMKEFDGKLFIGLNGGAGASQIATWDGISIVTEKTGIDAPTCMATYRVQDGGDALIVGTATSNTVYIRPASPTGASTEAWYTSLGAVASVEMTSYKDVLYIADGAGNIRSWDGSAFAIAHSPAGATAVRTLTTFNGYLYVGYETATAAIIAKFDGSTWTSAEKNITTQFSTVTSIRSLAAYRGFLLAGATKTSVGGRIYVSPGTATSGTYTEIAPNANNNGSILALVVG